MLYAKKVTPYQEHQLRASLGAINTKINAYKHTDEIEGSSYIKNKKYNPKKHDSSWTQKRINNSQI